MAKNVIFIVTIYKNYIINPKFIIFLNKYILILKLLKYLIILFYLVNIYLKKLIIFFFFKDFYYIFTINCFNR